MRGGQRVVIGSIVLLPLLPKLLFLLLLLNVSVIVPLLYVSVTVVTTHSTSDVAQAGKERIPLSRQLREKQRSLLRA